jgi:hypothetical protein
MLKKLLYALLILLALLILIGAFLPTHFTAAQTVAVRADRARVHEFVGDLRRWDEWGPWKDEDPSLVVTRGDLTTGIGAHQSWTGDSGNGELTFTQCSLEQGITYDMLFIDGEQKMPAKSWMSYAPAGAATLVTWGLEGDIDMPIVGGWIVLMMGPSLDDMLEKGLTKLKTVAEAGR